MSKEYLECLDRLKNVGWMIRLQKARLKFPPNIEARYSWVPLAIKEFIIELESATSPDEKTWLLGMPDFSGSSTSAFKWNEWELISLSAAEGDSTLTESIHQFWDQHFPVVFSVENGYTYFVLRKSDLKIVRGEEPEFEDPKIVASSFNELLYLFANPDLKS